jgi:hypothetical protein
MASKSRGITSYIGAASNSYGLIQSYSATTSVDIEEAKDNLGNVKEYDDYNAVLEVTMELIPASGSTMPAVGAEIACTHGKIVITSVTDSESNTGYPTFSCTGKRYVTNSIPAT